MNKLAFIGGALAIGAAVSLAGCGNQTATTTPAISAAAIQADAKTAVQTFCSVGMPASAPFAADLNGQLQQDYATVSEACTALGDGQTINPVTVAAAALDLYNGLKATYPTAFKALSPRDLAALRRIRVPHVDRAGSFR